MSSSSSSTRIKIMCNEHYLQATQICLNKYCKETRIFCQSCIKQQKHSGHQQDWENANRLDSIIQQSKLKFQTLQTNLNAMIDDVLLMLHRIPQALEERFNIPIEKFEQLNQRQINEYLIHTLRQSEQEKIIIELMEIIQFEIFEKISLCSTELDLDQKSFRSEIKQLEMITKKPSDIESSLSKNQLPEKSNNQQIIPIKVESEFQVQSTQLSKQQQIKNNQQEGKNENEDEEVFYKQGHQLYTKNEYKAAITSLDKCLAINPTHLDGLYCKGTCLLKLRSYQDALNQFDSMLKINPNNTLALKYKSECLRLMRKFKDALVFYDKALDSEPKNVGLMWGKGECLANLNEIQQAEQMFDEGLKIDPNHFLCLVSKGGVLTRYSKLDEAIVFLDKAKQINPNHPFYKLHMGMYNGKEFVQILLDHYD